LHRRAEEGLFAADQRGLALITRERFPWEGLHQPTSALLRGGRSLDKLANYKFTNDKFSMSDLGLIFQQEYRALRPRAPLPEFQVEFFPFTGVNNTIRLREGRMKVRLSDVLEPAPLYHQP
jgi:hypothetical protein